MAFETLTLKRIEARPVVLRLRRPVVARIATLTDWPLILIDLYTDQGVVGRALTVTWGVRRARGCAGCPFSPQHITAFRAVAKGCGILFAPAGSNFGLADASGRRSRAAPETGRGQVPSS